ncbi:L-arabinose isomerase-like protein [Microbacterium sp. SLBN-146]|nr:L-arabinose isomerase-like protein [Microbacterium sp. SLBN-146]
MTRTPLARSLDAYEVWFVTGSQNLYGEETLRQVAEQSQASGWRGRPDYGGREGWAAGATGRSG